MPGENTRGSPNITVKDFHDWIKDVKVYVLRQQGHIFRHWDSLIRVIITSVAMSVIIELVIIE